MNSFCTYDRSSQWTASILTTDHHNEQPLYLRQTITMNSFCTYDRSSQWTASILTTDHHNEQPLYLRQTITMNSLYTYDRPSQWTASILTTDHHNEQPLYLRQTITMNSFCTYDRSVRRGWTQSRHKYTSAQCTSLPPHTRCHQCSSCPPSLLKSHQHWYFIRDRRFWNHTSTDTSYVTVISEITPTLIHHIGRFVISHFWNHTNTDRPGKTGRVTQRRTAGTEVKCAGYFLLSQFYTTSRVHVTYWCHNFAQQAECRLLTGVTTSHNKQSVGYLLVSQLCTTGYLLLS